MSVQRTPPAKPKKEADLGPQSPLPPEFVAALELERQRTSAELDQKFQALFEKLRGPPPPPSALGGAAPTPKPQANPSAASLSSGSPPATLPPLSREQAFAALTAEQDAERAALHSLYGQHPVGAQFQGIPPQIQAAARPWTTAAAPTFVDPPRPLRQSPLGYNQQLSSGGTEASKISVVPQNPGYVPVNPTYRLGRRPAFLQPGARADPRRWSDLEWLACYPLWDKNKPGSSASVVSTRDKHELHALGPATDALGDVIGFLAGDPTGRIDIALPLLKSVFENLAHRRGTLEAGALGDMGLISTDRAATYRAVATDEEERLLARDLPPEIAGRLMSLTAKTTEAVFNETAKARAKEKVAALVAAGKKKAPPGGPPGGAEGGTPGGR